MEENVEQSLLREEEALLSEEGSKANGSSDDSASLQKALRENKTKYEVSDDLIGS